MLAQFRFFDESDTSSYLVGATVRACSRDDLDCVAPESEGVTDREGRVTLPLVVAPDSEGWTGYLEVTAVEGSGYPVNLITTVRPFTDSPNSSYGIVSEALLNGAGALISGSLPDPTRGHLAVRVFDCSSESAAGAAVVVSPAEGASIGYLGEDVIPDPDLEATGPIGLAAAVNVEPGFADVSLTLGPGGPLIGQTTVPVRAGAITTFGLGPTP
jgi:hypothetical protein